MPLRSPELLSEATREREALSAEQDTTLRRALGLVYHWLGPHAGHGRMIFDAQRGTLAEQPRTLGSQGGQALDVRVFLAGFIGDKAGEDGSQVGDDLASALKGQRLRLGPFLHDVSSALKRASIPMQASARPNRQALQKAHCGRIS